jgi:hypothetical protein
MNRCGLKQLQLDPCLFIGKSVICIVNIDDLLFWNPKEEYIYDFGVVLQSEEVKLKEEGDAGGFLGIKLQQNDAIGHLHMTQEGLIKLGGPLIILSKKIAPNAIFRVVSCLCILCDLTCLIWLKNSTHSLSYMAYRCITVFTNKTPYLSSVFTTV